MAKQNIAALTTDELNTKLNDARDELMKLRFQQATGELSDTTRLKVTRRLIARLLTELNQRNRTAQMESES
ncbi:MAG TPA: 50S ribosomal protein L29 [Anaerolineales bacterium]|nr:50S ribosomal protein L29 [Anaerolineales bacterium]